MSLDRVYREGVSRIWQEDRSSQEEFLSIIAQVRGMQSFDFETIKAVFIPNDQYLLQYFDAEILDPQYGFYDYENRCFWNNCMIIPIYNVADKVVSVCGFNPFRYLQAKEEKDWSLNYYVYASSKSFRKGAFLFYLEGCYQRAFDDGYLFLTDGIFDTISLQLAGFNAAAMMGSSLTPEIMTMLKFIKRVLLVCDNDEAGYKVSEQLKKKHKNVTIVKQGKTKDIDELLKSDKRELCISELHRALKSMNCSTFTLNV